MAYDCVALLWITKLFNIYNLNWWPSKLGLPSTILAVIVVSLAIPIPIYYTPATQLLVRHNTLWVLLTFFSMLMPVIVAFGKLLKSERYLGLQNHIPTRKSCSCHLRGLVAKTLLAQGLVKSGGSSICVQSECAPRCAGWSHSWGTSTTTPETLDPASFVRFIWFCLAMFIGLLAYVLGAYAEVYLRTLPHNNIDTVIYVYSWSLRFMYLMVLWDGS
jgi:hypothetical protein